MSRLDDIKARFESKHILNVSPPIKVLDGSVALDLNYLISRLEEAERVLREIADYTEWEPRSWSTLSDKAISYFSKGEK